MPVNKNCIICKGKDPLKYCNRKYCPLISKTKIYRDIADGISKESFSGDAPAPFVGRYNYPDVNVGILSTTTEEKNSWEYDFPKHWAMKNYDEEKIVDFRSSLVHSRTQSNIKSKNDKIIEIVKEIALAIKPPEVEINLEKTPSFSLNLDNYSAPTGPVADLKNAQVTSNVKTSVKIERIVDDTDLKATQGAEILYKKGFDENTISKLLSVGNLGVGKNRKLVPTRWSITATDDLITKKIITEIKQNKLIDNYRMYCGNHLGNYYYIMFLPSIWSFELFETYAKGVSFNQSGEVSYTTDYENYNGRKDYASQCTGGYYAARFPVTEKLKQMKRQASVLVLRFITDEYTMPLGVWVCREASRKALKKRPLCFESKSQMLSYMKRISKIKFGYDTDVFIEKSKMLREIRTQSRLSEWM